MSPWPLTLVLPEGALEIPGPGRYALAVEAEEAVIEGTVGDLLDASRLQLGPGAVGWMPEDGGLLSNLPAWENVLLSTQWHAPASLPALEKRVTGWCAQLGYDKTGIAALLARQPAHLDEDERRLVGWLRVLLSRPRLVVLRAGALPGYGGGDALRTLLGDELAGSALVAVDEYVPAGFEPLATSHTGDLAP